jgi:hypothetical protein
VVVHQPKSVASQTSESDSLIDLRSLCHPASTKFTPPQQERRAFTPTGVILSTILTFLVLVIQQDLLLTLPALQPVQGTWE